MTNPTPTAPKFPDVSVALVGEDGNAFAIIGRVSRALRGAGADRDAIAEFRREAMSGDYDHLLRTCMTGVDAR